MYGTRARKFINDIVQALFLQKFLEREGDTNDETRKCTQASKDGA